MKIVKSPRHAIHRSGEFGNFSGEVTSLIYHAQKLIERRAKVIASITSLVRYHAQPAWKKSNDETISFFDEALQNILDEIRKKNYHIDKEETNVDMYTAAMIKNFSVGVPVPSTTAGDIELIFSCEQNKVTSDYKNAQGEQGSSRTSGDLSKG